MDDGINQELLLEIFGEQPICIHRCLLRLTGSITAALMLTRAVSITLDDLPVGSDGWFSQSQEEWQGEIGLTRFEQESARKHLREMNILLERRVGMPARLQFRICASTLAQLLGDQAQTNHGTAVAISKAQQRRLPA